MRHYNICGAPLASEDVAMIRGLVRDYCARCNFEKQGAEAEDAARQILWQFQCGVTDREDLRRLLPPV
jgi:hypothetical protein